jgi:hypothetical protein
VYLLEDALELWGSLLAQADEASPQILELTNLLFPMFDTASESLKKALELLEAYIILAPGQFLQHSLQFLSVFNTLLSSKLNREATELIVHVVQVYIQVAEDHAGTAGIEHLAPLLVQSGILPTILAQIKNAHDAHQTSGPNRVQSELDAIVEGDYFCVLASVMQAAPNTFVQCLTASTSSSIDQATSWLLKEWFVQLDTIAAPQRKKLCCLGLTALLQLGPEPWLTTLLQSYISMWTDVLAECMENPEDGSGIDCFVWNDPDGSRAEGHVEAPEERRKRHLQYKDPVHRVNVKEHIAAHLLKLVESCGGIEKFRDEWLVNVDRDVVQAFGKMGVL